MSKPKYTAFVRGSRDARRATKNVLVRGLDDIQSQSREKAEEAAEHAGQTLLNHTDPYVPEDTGTLRESGRYELTTTKTNKVAVEVTYGSDSDINPKTGEPSSSYAVFVHEDAPQGVPKNYTKPGTGPHYLTKGAADAYNEIVKIFKNKLDEVGE